jgi:hypothetical protein
MTVDDAGGGDRESRPSARAQTDRPSDPEQRHVDDQHQAHAQARAAGVEVLFNPVVRRVVAVALHGLGVLGLGPVEFGALVEDLLDAEDVRAVRITFVFAFGVVLAVDGRPLLGDHAGGHPEPEAEEVRRDRVQVQRPVCGMAVQVDGDAGDRDVREHQGHDKHLPPGGARQAAGQKLDQAIPDSREDSGIGRKHGVPKRPPWVTDMEGRQAHGRCGPAKLGF